VELLDAEYMRAIDISAESDDIHKQIRVILLLSVGLAGMEGAAILTAAAMFKTGTWACNYCNNRNFTADYCGKSS
jgi:hypothetical protein